MQVQMTDELNALHDGPSFNLARLTRRGRGALVCGLFGSFWIFSGAYGGGLTGPAPLTAFALCAIAFVVWPAARLVSLRRFSTLATDRQRTSSLGGAYLADVAVECLACIGAVTWLAHIRRFDLIPQSFGFIIGLHFLPLAKIFKMPIYYATGTVMIFAVAASLLFPVGNVRNFSACSVIGISLWATAAANLWQDRPSSRMLSRRVRQPPKVDIL
jgi:hypothetical protein